MLVAARKSLWKKKYDYDGTALVVKASAGNMMVTLASGELAYGSSAVEIDWGDGDKRTQPGGIYEISHTYSKEGYYTIKISDDLRSFAFVRNGENYAKRGMLIELLSLGNKVVSIPAYGFNNCHNMRGVLNLNNVTSIGNYALGTTRGISAIILPEIKALKQVSFYANDCANVIVADKVTQIDSRFWDYYNGRDPWDLPTDMYLRGLTRAQIKSMVGFPFLAPATARFHGSDGIVRGDGTYE